jgi:Heavy-metal resistance protein CzcE
MVTRLRLALGSLAALTILAASPATPADEPSERYGSLATGMPYDRDIRVGPNTRRIGVWRLETIRFVIADGQAFTWRFDGLRAFDAFPLERLAPPDVAVPRGVTVFLNGEIPIAP